jgi:hypothetical protein
MAGSGILTSDAGPITSGLATVLAVREFVLCDRMLFVPDGAHRVCADVIDRSSIRYRRPTDNFGDMTAIQYVDVRR